jgi:hypothetical protein
MMAMKVSLFVLWILFMVAACTAHKGVEDPVLSSRISSLWQVGSTYRYINEAAVMEMEKKAQRLVTAEKASLWQPKQKRVDILCKAIIDSIASLQREIYSEHEIAALSTRNWTGLPEGRKLGAPQLRRLERWLKDLEQAMLRTDPIVASEFTSFDFVYGTRRHASSSAKDLGWLTGNSNAETFLNLQQLKVNIQQHQNILLNFFNEQIGCLDCGSYESFSAIVAQSASVVLPGERVTINAGVGAFSRAARPEITVQGRPVALDADGQATKSFFAPRKTGACQVPVLISFINQDGQRMHVRKIVEYRVVDTLCR